MNETRPSNAPQRDIARVEEALRALLARARALVIAQRVLTILAAAGAAVFVLALLDYMLRLPAGLRAVHLAIGVAALAGAFARWVWPAIRFRPPLTSIALRIERQRPELRGVLASALEFDQRRRSDPAGAQQFTGALAQRIVERTAMLWTNADLRGALRTGDAVRAAGIALALVVVVAALGVVQPTLTAIGAKRALLPMSGAQWPKRTAVVDLSTDVDVHPMGRALPLRAAVTRSNRQMDRTDVYVRYRPSRDGRARESARLLMTWQERDVDVAPGANQGARSGSLFERLVETDADAIEYRFETDDDQTPWRTIRLVEPPALVSATALITPPTYAARLAGAEGWAERSALASQQSLDLGRGMDERALAPPVLAGSSVEMTITLNKPAAFTPDDSAWIARTFGPELAAADPQIAMGQSASEWTARWSLERNVRIPVTLVDEHGIDSVEEHVYRFQAVEDAPPSVTVVRPENDQSVLPTAVIGIVAEARDDVGLEAVWITHQRHAPAGTGQPSGPGGAVEPIEEPVELSRTALDGARTLESSASLDLAAIGVRPGQEVWVQALATDVFTSGATAREPSRSPVRRLLVVSQEEFIEQIRSELAGVRQAAMSIDQQQAALREQTTRDGADAQTRRGQAQITERVTRERAQLQRILDRIETNALDDDDLSGLIQAGARTVDEAARRSGEAASALDEAAQSEADGRAELDEEQAQRVEDDQRAVQEQLAQLVELLDSGEDAWVLRRRLEELLREQRELRQSTQQAGAETAGRAPEELAPEERSELERIVEAQRELAQRTRDTVDELREGARRLEERDPATSEGLAQAARRAEQSAASERMEQAAQQAQQNQTASASRAQEQAEQALEEMLEDLDQSQRAREEVLRRLLLSLIDSLDALINDQQAQLDALNEADRQGLVDTAEPPLDGTMVRLNRNTVGVLDLAKGGGPELVSVVSLIGRASESQTRAIIALRARPVPVERARTNEQESLERLREAKREAERIDEEMQDRIQERKQRELREAYRDALRRQIELRTRTGAFANVQELSRRDAAEVRRLSEPQGEIRADIQRLLEEMTEISEARVFDYAHRRLDGLLRDAQRDLESVSPAPATRSQDTAIALLRGLLEAMRDAQEQGDEFREGEQGGGGGGSSQQGEQPLIPGLAQLRLLREMQADLAARTRLLDESGEPAGATGVERIGSEQQDLAELGAELVEELRQQQAGPAGPAGPGRDDPDAGGE